MIKSGATGRNIKPRINDRCRDLFTHEEFIITEVSDCGNWIDCKDKHRIAGNCQLLSRPFALFDPIERFAHWDGWQSDPSWGDVIGGYTELDNDENKRHKKESWRDAISEE